MHRFLKRSRVEHQQEVSSVSGEVILCPRGDANLYLPNYRAAFACSHFRYPHRHRFHLAMDFPLAGSNTGLPCSAEMTRSVRSALRRQCCLPMAKEPEASALTARRAAQHFRLSSADDAYEH